MHFPLKTLDNILANLNTAQYFIKLDADKVVWKIKESEITQDHLTFSTPWARYKFTRSKFGLASAPKVAQN